MNAPTPQQLAQLQQLAGDMGIDLEKLVDQAATQIEYGAGAGEVDLMALLAQDHPVDDQAVAGSFDELLGTLEPRWARLMRWVADRLAERVPGQAEAMPKMLLEWALGMFTAEVARDPEGLRGDVIDLVRQCCRELEISAGDVFAADGTVVTEERGDG